MDIIRQALAIGFVFVLLGGALWLMRTKGVARFRYSRASEQSLLTLCGKLSLGPQHSVHVVRIGDRQLVLGVHPAGITHLCDLTGAPEVRART